MSSKEEKSNDIWESLESLPEKIKEGHKYSKWTIIRIFLKCIDDLERIARESYESEIKLAIEQPMEYLKHSTGADETVSGYVIILKDALLHLLRFLPNQIKESAMQNEEEPTKDVRNELKFSLHEAFEMLCQPNDWNPYLLVGIGTAKDGCKKVMTVLTNIDSNPWQNTDVAFLGTVNLSRLKPGDADRILAKYEKKIDEYVDNLTAK